MRIWGEIHLSGAMDMVQFQQFLQLLQFNLKLVKILLCFDFIIVDALLLCFKSFNFFVMQ